MQFEFEYDQNKSVSNLEKHGIDFEQAKQLWEDDQRAEVAVAYEGEERHAVFGMIEDKHWTAIITYRREAIRIISVRRSRKAEEAIYHG